MSKGHREFDPFDDAFIGIEALSEEANRRRTSYGKLIPLLSQDDITAIIETYRRNHKRRKRAKKK